MLVAAEGTHDAAAAIEVVEEAVCKGVVAGEEFLGRGRVDGWSSVAFRFRIVHVDEFMHGDVHGVIRLAFIGVGGSKGGLAGR